MSLSSLKTIYEGHFYECMNAWFMHQSQSRPHKITSNHTIQVQRFNITSMDPWVYPSHKACSKEFCTCRSGSTKVPRVFNLLSDTTGTHNCSWASTICLKRPRLSVVSHDNKLKLVLDLVSALHPKKD